MGKLLIIVLFTFLISSLSKAQTTGILEGRIYVKDSVGHYISSLIQLFQNNKKITEIQTDSRGYYKVENLLAGSYKVNFSCKGYETKKRVVTIVAGQTTRRDTKLERQLIVEIEEQINEITVEASEAELEPLIIREDIERIPTVSEDISYMKTLAPPVYKTANRENYAVINENEFKLVKKEKLSTFSIDVDRAAYSNVRRFLNSNQKPPKDAVRIEEMINYFNYDYPQPKGNHPFNIITEIADCPWNKEAKLLHIGLQGKEINLDKAPNNNLVFLMDVSGSMTTANKLPLVKSSLKLLINKMRDEDRIAIVVYAGAAGLVLPSTKGSERHKIIAALDQLNAGGSTAGGAGIKLAYKIAKENFLKEGNNRVILTTDGDFNVGLSSNDDLEKLIVEKRNDNIFLTVLGFGTGNYQDQKMETLADKGNGNYAYIDGIKEAKKTLVKEMGGTLFTIAKDVKIQLEFKEKFVKSYRLIGYENRLLENKDFKDDKKDAGELGAGHTVTALYEIVLTKNNSNSNQEIMKVNLRYKEPKGTVSTLITHTVKNNFPALNETSDNFRFAASVAGFGMLLRDSKFKNDLTYKEVLDLAKGAKGLDKEGYRDEFIGMVKNVNSMTAHAKK